MKQIEFVGTESIQHLGQYLKEQNAKRVFLVTGKNSFNMSGAKEKINIHLNTLEVFHFTDFSENPKIEDVEKGLDLFLAVQPEIVIAVDGGSAIDVAKLINIFAVQSSSPEMIAYGKAHIENKGKPLIAIPTTAGAGSESTHFAVLYIHGVKYSISDNAILPNASFVDPQFTYCLSPRQTAISGVDALCQAIESYWSIHSTEESKLYAKNAIISLLKYLPDCVFSPNPLNREKVAIAAHDAGKAINISKTTASHAISYSMTSRFNVPHGQAVSLTLPDFLEFNFNVTHQSLNDKRGLSYVKQTMIDLLSLFHCDNIDDGKRFLMKFMKDVGLSVNLNDVGILEGDISHIVQSVNIDRLQNNPRNITSDDIELILKNLLILH